MKRATVRMAAWSVSRPKTTLLIVALAMTLALVRLPHLSLRTSNLDLIDPELPEVKRFLTFAQDFGTLNPLVVVLETQDPDAAKVAVDALAENFEKLPRVRTVLAKLPYPQEFLAENDLEPYLCTLDESLFFIFLQPQDHRSQTAELTPFVADVREVLEQTGFNRNAVKAGMTGIPKYALDDQEIISQDITLLSILALALIGLIFFLGFRRLAGPLSALLALVAGLVLTLGAASFTPGYLTVLSSMFASIILGLGIDYGIHIAYRVQSLDHLPRERAIMQTLEELAAPLLTACLTTVGVFLVLCLSDFKGFADLGVIAAFGMSFCFLMMYTVMPALLLLLPHKPLKKGGSSLVGAALMAIQKPGPRLAFVLITILAIFTGFPGFDGNYLDLQPAQSEAVRLERLMVEDSDFAPNFAVFTTPDEATASELTQRLREEPTVASVRSLSDIRDLTEGPVPEAPSAFKSLFVNDKGQYAVYAYPMNDIWDSTESKAFLDAMRAIDPQVTGMPFLGEFMMNRSYQALRKTSLLAFLVLVVLAVWDFRNWQLALLAVSGPLLTLLWMGAAMKWLGQEFNPLNIMAMPIVLGIAVDDAVHILHRLKKDSDDLNATMHSAGHGVLLTTLTTLAAFGALAFSRHLGLRSFCIALCLGVAAAFINAVLFLPMLQRLFSGGNAAKN